jgi:hypothetical protein
MTHFDKYLSNNLNLLSDLMIFLLYNKMKKKLEILHLKMDIIVYFISCVLYSSLNLFVIVTIMKMKFLII